MVVTTLVSMCGETEVFYYRILFVSHVLSTSRSVFVCLCHYVLCVNVVICSRELEVVRAVIPFSACLEAFVSPTFVDDFYSSAINARTTAKK